MPLLSVIIMAVGLAMDAFAVSIACGTSLKKVKLRHALLIGGTFGLFQAGMPLLGWLLGRYAYTFIANVDYWIAFGLLFFAGGHMIIQAVQPAPEENAPPNPLAPATLLGLGVATSIDAFAIGISLSMLRVFIWTPAFVIGLVAFLFSFAGVYAARLFGRLDERKMEMAGGMILIGLGFKVLIKQLSQHHTMFDAAGKVWFALALTAVAGLATGIGSLMALFARRTSTRRFSFLLGVSTGLLLWLAFMNLVPLAVRQLGDSLHASLAFLAGFALAGLIDRLVPDYGNPHEPLMIEDFGGAPVFRRTGMFAALAIAAHSFPEGIALFVVAMQAPVLVAVGVALAIALHNIPEGIATALPMFHATGSRGKSCFFSALTGLSEPLGALIGFTLLYRFVDIASLGVLTAGGAGVLIFVALDGLLPAARVYGRYHHSIYGVLVGMALALGLTVLAG